jgi:DNA-binding Lrp family transcriptional regulator
MTRRRKSSRNSGFSHISNNNNANSIDLDTHINDYSYTLTIDNLDQKLIELILKGHENRKIAREVETPLSTIQRRIRKIYQNQYINRKVEINYNKLGLRKGYLHISLKGDNSHVVAQKITALKGIISVSEVIGSGFDIMSACIFRETDDLFKIMEEIKGIERVDKVVWSEEVRSLPVEEKYQNLVESSYMQT